MERFIEDVTSFMIGDNDCLIARHSDGTIEVLEEVEFIIPIVDRRIKRG